MKIQACLVAASLILVGCSETAPTQSAQEETAPTVALASLENQPVEVGCGSCMYAMEGVSGCQTAVMIEGTPRLVGGIGFDAHKNGLCSATKQALVSGDMEGDTFVATMIELQ